MCRSEVSLENSSSIVMNAFLPIYIMPVSDSISFSDHTALHSSHVPMLLFSSPKASPPLKVEYTAQTKDIYALQMLQES